MSQTPDETPRFLLHYPLYVFTHSKMKLSSIKVAALIQLGVAGLNYGYDRSATSMYLAASFAMFLLSKEVINDERVEHLKLKALRFGFGVGLVVTIWMYLFDKIFRPKGAMATR